MRTEHIRRASRLIINLRFASQLAGSGALFSRPVRRRPEILAHLLSKPFINSSWDCETRIRYFVDHCKTTAEIGGVFAAPIDEVIDLARLAPIDSSYRLTIDQPSWVQTEGLVAFSLWEDIDRIFQLTFCLSSQHGELTALIGSIQGRAGAESLDRYRRFTRLAQGMRPKDFLVEAFKMFCRSLRIQRILAVSDAAHTERACASHKFSYDETWLARGGVNQADGFFRLAVAPARRAASEIPVRKRGQYAHRYQMLDEIEKALVVGASRSRSCAVAAAAREINAIVPGRG